LPVGNQYADGCSHQYCEDVSSSVSIDEADLFFSSLNIFPNPTSEFATVSLSNIPAGTVQVTLLDIQGRKVFETSVKTTGTLNYQVPVSTLDEGI
jgi:hypothetical protein